MHLSDKELRKMLNKAWDKARNYSYGPNEWRRLHQSGVRRRYRDVSKIIKEAMPKLPKPQVWDNLPREEKP